MHAIVAKIITFDSFRHHRQPTSATQNIATSRSELERNVREKRKWVLDV